MPLGGAQPIPPAGVNCRQEPECARLFNEAKEHSRAGRLSEAQRVYEQAYQRRADPQLLFNLARVLHRDGRPAEAIPYYQKYLEAGADGNEEQKRKTEEYLAQARAQIAVPESPPPPTPTPTPTPTPVRPARSDTPVYRRWWLWTAVGAVACGIAVGVGLGLASRRPDISDTTVVQPF